MEQQPEPPQQWSPERIAVGQGPLVLDVDPTAGARVTVFAYEGRNLLMPVSHSNGFLNGGSTLWTSPQSDWSWPPVAAHDESPYNARIEGSVLITRSQPAELAGSSVTLSKRFDADPTRGAIRAQYGIHNEGAAPVSLAAWEVSRHPVGGLTFWAGNSSRGDYTPLQLGGFLWLPYADLWSGSNGKIFADSEGGFLAHLQDDLLVVRYWQDVPAAAQAPNEAEIEVYFSDGYVELETQGPYGPVAPGDQSSFTIFWTALPVPAGTDTSPGSAALIDLARSALR